MKTRMRNVMLESMLVVLLTLSIGHADLNDGLIAYWCFDDIDYPAIDCSDNGNDGTVYGAVSTTGKLGNALWFDGIDDLVTVPSDPLNLGTSDITLSAWIRANLTGLVQGIIDKRNEAIASSAGYSLNLGVGIEGGQKLAYATIGDGIGLKAVFYTNSEVVDGEWHLVTAVADRDAYGQMYVDGVPDGDPVSISYRSGSMNNNYNLQLGQTVASYGTPGKFYGAIDEARIYNRILSETEIKALSGDTVALVQDLTETVIDLNLQNGIANSLDAKLDTVLQALDDLNENNDIAAVNALDAFINAVEAQQGKIISEEGADALIEAAQNIIDLLTDR